MKAEDLWGIKSEVSSKTTANRRDDAIIYSILVLQLVLIFFKITGFVNLSWWVILSPMIFLFSLIAAFSSFAIYIIINAARFKSKIQQKNSSAGRTAILKYDELLLGEYRGQWFSFEKSSPVVGEKLLFFRIDENFITSKFGYYVGNFEFFSIEEEEIFYGITHWTYLPELPRC